MGMNMKIMKLTTPNGTFFNCDYSPELIKQTIMRAPDWQKIELVEISREEYFRIPATNASAELWKA
jgi:hypothetical protein